MVSKFSTKNKINTELLEDILKDKKGLDSTFQKEIYSQRYNTMTNNFDLIEFSGFVFSLTKMYIKHPIQMYNTLHSDNKK